MNNIIQVSLDQDFETLYKAIDAAQTCLVTAPDEYTEIMIKGLIIVLRRALQETNAAKFL